MRAIELNGVKPARNMDAFTWGRVLVHDRAAVERVADLPTSPVLTLDEMIARRAAFLTGYQNASWAQEYLREIGKIREAEIAATGAAGALTEAAAKGLFKLMSYKDEYEVARLHTQTGFEDDLAARFDGPFKLVHHMAPPGLAGGRDARGRPLKRAFGPWIRPAMRLLAKMKPLRGTALDPFGYSEERKMERALIAEYRALLDHLTAGLTFENRDDRAAKAALVMDIRGFGPVKRAAAMGVRAQMAEISADNGTQSDRSAAIM